MMKRSHVKLAPVFFILSSIVLTVNLPAQEQNSDEITALGFTAKKAAENVWLIDDHRNDNMYLVLGKDKALLIDTGIGAGNLKKFIESITKLPLTVVNTHSHRDHVNSDFQFDEVYIHPKEIEAAKKALTKENRDIAVDGVLKNYPHYDPNDVFQTEEYKTSKFIPVEEVNLFDLGNRRLEVIEVPGHTPGCICLLDKENRLLFSGDNNCIHVWLFMDNSTSVETYMRSLEKLMTYSDYFDTILPGHLKPMGKDYLDELHTCVKNILTGNCEPKPYQSFGDNVKCCTYERAIVAFDPNRLFDIK